MFVRLPLISLLIVLSTLQACDQSDHDISKQTSTAQQSSAWVRDEVSSHAVLTSDAVNALAESIEEAQRTAHEAREQFNKALPHERVRYALQWMARTVDGSREFVWVRPVEWSPFRIEGVLLSQPTGELEVGAVPGELVSFPIEELADWVILDDNHPGTAVKGATTLNAIEQRIGTPSTK